MNLNTRRTSFDNILHISTICLAITTALQSEPTVVEEFMGKDADLGPSTLNSRLEAKRLLPSPAWRELKQPSQLIFLAKSRSVCFQHTIPLYTMVGTYRLPSASPSPTFRLGCGPSPATYPALAKPPEMSAPTLMDLWQRRMPHRSGFLAVCSSTH